MNLTCEFCGFSGAASNFGMSIRFGYTLRCDTCFKNNPPPAVLKPHKCRICKTPHPKIEYPKDYICGPCQAELDRKRVERILADACRVNLQPDRQKCRVCAEIKPLDQFGKSKTTVLGVTSICKACHGAIYNPQQKAKRAAIRAARPPKTCKCMRCGESKTTEHFPKRPDLTTGRGRYCLVCDGIVQYERIQRVGRILNEPKSHRRRKGLVALLSDGTLTPEVERELRAAAKDCPYCGHEMAEDDKTLDHMTPISRGGPHSRANVLICCQSCNSRKQDKHFSEWLGLLEDEHRKRMERLYRRRVGAAPNQGRLFLIYHAEKLPA